MIMAEHIDNDRLQNEIHYRFDYFSKLINFTTEAVTALNTFASAALPVIPDIVDSVYRKVFQYDDTKNYFIIHNENLSLESAPVAYRRDMLSGYFKRVLLQREWANEFLAYISTVGRMHTNKSLLIEAVWSNESLGGNIKRSILLALNKVFRIQSDLFLMDYLESSQDNSSTPTTFHEKGKCICS
ncbi:unnamed protein product [Rotaria socialis]|uniref:Globin-sensor domain-containing protein n=2 Tax=Rotaria socialis TaxID=392032 RepID=A0A817LW77_9BILA|nr:unnamed protein product [Rotaria socialis]CAF3545117.1 unnamed protein product [Rotaria socialis]CAF4380206.1 unnamed protein product [Rotaria socialis]CAF4503020.1 unnamed protein product [Rotaria socialis]